VPPPREHLTRFHGVFAPNARLRAQVTPSGRGKRPVTDATSPGAEGDHRSPEDKGLAMTWAQRLNRVFGIDVTTCLHCGGVVRIVASVEEPTAIRAILVHFEKHGALEQAHDRPAARATATPGRVMRCRPHSRQRDQDPVRCGYDTAELRSARRRESVRTGAGMRRCTTPWSRILRPAVKSVPRPALARPPTTQRTG
jgi:hypothetical protein